MARALITGGAGFIGSHLAKAVIAAGDEVHLVVRPGSDDRRLPPLEGRFVRHDFDLRSEEALRRCVAEIQPEIVYHLAARPRRPERADFADVREMVDEDLHVLVELLAALARVAKPPRMFVRAGSLAEYGLAPVPFEEAVRELPLTPYATGLVASSHLLKMLDRRLPFPAVTARLALVYGPAQSADYLVPFLIGRCLAGEKAIVRHPGDRRDLIHVDDAVDGLMRLARLPVPPGTLVNLASGFAPRMRDVAALIVERTGADPSLVTFGDSSASSGIADFRGSGALAEELIGWRPLMPLSEGIVRTIEWYRRRMEERSQYQTAEAAQ